MPSPATTEDILRKRTIQDDVILSALNALFTPLNLEPVSSFFDLVDCDFIYKGAFAFITEHLSQRTTLRDGKLLPEDFLNSYTASATISMKIDFVLQLLYLFNIPHANELDADYLVQRLAQETSDDHSTLSSFMTFVVHAMMKLSVTHTTPSYAVSKFIDVVIGKSGSDKSATDCNPFTSSGQPTIPKPFDFCHSSGEIEQIKSRESVLKASSMPVASPIVEDKTCINARSSCNSPVHTSFTPVDVSSASAVAPTAPASLTTAQYLSLPKTQLISELRMHKNTAANFRLHVSKQKLTIEQLREEAANFKSQITTEQTVDDSEGELWKQRAHDLYEKSLGLERRVAMLRTRENTEAKKSFDALLKMHSELEKDNSSVKSTRVVVLEYQVEQLQRMLRAAYESLDEALEDEQTAKKEYHSILQRELDKASVSETEGTREQRWVPETNTPSSASSRKPQQKQRPGFEHDSVLNDEEQKQVNSHSNTILRKFESSKSEAGKLKTNNPITNKFETSKSEISKSEIQKLETNKPKTVQSKNVNPETDNPETKKHEASKPETEALRNPVNKAELFEKTPSKVELLHPSDQILSLNESSFTTHKPKSNFAEHTVNDGKENRGFGPSYSKNYVEFIPKYNSKFAAPAYPISTYFAKPTNPTKSTFFAKSTNPTNSAKRPFYIAK